MSSPLEYARPRVVTGNTLGRQVRPFSLKSINWKAFTPRNMYISARDFCLHLKHGTQQFGRDLVVAWGYTKKVLRGEELSRQERRQLNQTVADMFRLVPFSIFVIVPFLELLLPVALAVFPNMLPTAFQSKNDLADKQIRQTKARIEYAKFLQDTLAEMAVDLKKRNMCAEVSATADELTAFLHKLKAGEISGISSFEITKFRKIFAEEIPLWKLERPQLQELCRFMSIAPFGPDALLRVNLRLALQKIKKDDRELFSIGVENLPYDELKLSCRARGIRTDFSGDHNIPREHREAYLRKQLDAWLHLSLKENLSNSLLLMLQVFSITQVAEVGQEVHKSVTADIHEEVDRERELALIQEELAEEKKEKEHTRLISLARAMKAEAALGGADRKVQQVQEELQEVKEDIDDTISRLREVTSLQQTAPADARTQASAQLLEKRLAAMTVALDHALAILPKRIAKEEEKEKERKKREKKKATEEVLVDAAAKEKAAVASMEAASTKMQEALQDSEAAQAAKKSAPEVIELHDTIYDAIDDGGHTASHPGPSALVTAPAQASALVETSPAEEFAAANQPVKKDDLPPPRAPPPPPATAEESQRVAAAHH
eukprot:GGOE01064385.1.p1 GENE.GGOE01064385.1~~GGOE01064385.1.p1  ORF type:complete len:683 (-),score=267.89 GGOE01064385.1:677-2488(-)